MPDFWEQFFKDAGASAKPGEPAEVHYRRGLFKGVQMGFAMARDRIAAKLEEQGRSITAAEIRKMELKRK